MDDLLLTPEQVGKVLQVSPRTVKNLLRSKDLAGLKVGRFWRVRPGDLLRYREGDVRGIFCRIIYRCGDPGWVSDGNNRAVARKVAGRLWSDGGPLPFDIRDMVGYWTKHQCYNYGQAARVLLDIIDNLDQAPA